MKRIVIILISLTVSLTVFSQYSETFGKISEIEVSTFYEKSTVNGIEMIRFNTVEDRLRDFSLNYGKVGLQNVLNAIEKGSIDDYKKSISDKALLYNINGIQWMVLNKFCFISNGKIYVLTYEPVNLNLQNAKFGNKESVRVTNKKLYLYRRDADGWKKASALIREDYEYNGDKVKSFYTNTNHFYGNDINKVDVGSVDKISNGMVFILLNTIIWNSQPYVHDCYNILLAFVPNGDETYNCSHYEPIKRFRELKGVTWDYMDYNVMATKQEKSSVNVSTLTSAFDTTSFEISGNAVTVRFNDRIENKRIETGSLCFDYTNGQIAYNANNSTIALKEIK
jgi:hypothetical protein